VVEGRQLVKDYVGLARAYEDGVISGVIPACRWVRLACERNRRDLSKQRTEAFPFYFDHSAAARICVAAESLPHIKGPKAKVVGQDEDGRRLWATIDLEPWQCWMLTTVFGWKRTDDDLRRFRVAFILVPRKNAKSTIAAVVSLFMLTSDGESGAECYSAATTRDQAKVIAEIVWEMAARSPQFRDFFGVRVGAKTTRVVEVPATASKFMPLSADAHSLDGLNISFAAVDELHAHRTRHVIDVIDTATGARPQPMLFITTTAGIDTGGICYEKLGYLERVLDGSVEDDSLFGVNYTIDEGDDWTQESTWVKANPNYGISVKPVDMARKAKEAQQSPAGINNFLTKHLNVWVRSESTWMPLEKWKACGSAELTPSMFAQYPCWVGVDLAEVRDVAAIVLLFRVKHDEWVCFVRLYLPSQSVERSPVARMSGWVRSGYLIETDGDTADFRRMEDDLIALCDSFMVQEIDFDRALAPHMIQNLKHRLAEKVGTDAAEKMVVVVPQVPATLTPAMQFVDKHITSKQLRHDANPVMEWMIGNVVAKSAGRDGSEVVPAKAGGKDSHNKIDGPAALFNAASAAMRYVETATPSVLAEWI
jgi:phage terminase large subunit-like protein